MYYSCSLYSKMLFLHWQSIFSRWLGKEGLILFLLAQGMLITMCPEQRIFWIFQPPFIFGQKYLMRKMTERSLCVVEENYTVKMRGRRKINLISPRVNWKSNKACCQPNSDSTRDLYCVEVEFGRISGKRLQHLPSKQCWFSGNAAKNLCVSWYSHLRPVKDMVWGSLDGHLALLVSLFLYWSDYVISQQKCQKEARKKASKGKLFETWDAPPWTQRIPILPELFRGEAILILFQSPHSQVPQFQQRDEDSKLEGWWRQKYPVLVLAPARDLSALAQLLWSLSFQVWSSFGCPSMLL